jgi:hypothetical protein
MRRQTGEFNDLKSHCNMMFDLKGVLLLKAAANFTLAFRSAAAAPVAAPQRSLLLLSSVATVAHTSHSSSSSSSYSLWSNQTPQ